MDCNLLGFSVHGILQARVLEWIAISFSRDIPNPGIKPRSPTLQPDALPSEPPGKSKVLANNWFEERVKMKPDQEIYWKVRKKTLF